jgi:hypothetical protein
VTGTDILLFDFGLFIGARNQKMKLTIFSSCKLFDNIGRFISLLERLRDYDPVVDADVVNQAGPVGARMR